MASMYSLHMGALGLNSGTSWSPEHCQESLSSIEPGVIFVTPKQK